MNGTETEFVFYPILKKTVGTKIHIGFNALLEYILISHDRILQLCSADLTNDRLFSIPEYLNNNNSNFVDSQPSICLIGSYPGRQWKAEPE